SFPLCRLFLPLLFLLTHPPPPPVSTLSLHDALPIFHASILPGAQRSPQPALAARHHGRSHGRWWARREGPPPQGAHQRPCERPRSEEHTSELQSRENLVCRLLLEKKNTVERKGEEVR